MNTVLTSCELEIITFESFFAVTMNSSATFMELLELLVCTHFLMRPSSVLKLGHHCCLWCHIQQDQLKLEPSKVSLVGHHH